MKSGKFISPAMSFPSTQPRVRWGPARARDPRPACPRTAPVSAPGSSPGGGWCDTTITWSYLAILFRSSLPVPGMASINQQPQLATNGRAKMSRRSVVGWLRQESVQVQAQHCGQGPGVPVRDLLLGAKHGHGGPSRRGAVVDETDTETAGQTLVKKQRSAATPKL